MNLDLLIEQFQSGAINYAPKIFLAIIIWFFGILLINILSHGFGKLMDKKEFDPSLKPFLRRLLNMLFKVVLFITILGTLGIEMTTFVAIIGAAGLAIGLVLSGTLQNFAGSVIILIHWYS